MPSRWPQAFAAAGDQVVAGVFDGLNFMRFRSCHDPAAAAAGAVFYSCVVLRAAVLIQRAGVRCVELPSCGWHMSFFGGGAAIKAKLKSYSHQEWNRPDIVSRRQAATFGIHRRVPCAVCSMQSLLTRVLRCR